jgi:hypothetical protein
VAVVLFFNGPIIIRTKESKWGFAGESFLCDIMDGEVMDQADAGEYNTNDISLLKVYFT